MVNRLRYVLAPLAGTAAGVATWLVVAPWMVSPLNLGLWSGVVSGSIAGFIGGTAVALFTPHNGLRIATFTGAFVSSILVTWWLFFGADRLGRPLLLWYWPIWIVPAFALGGWVIGVLRDDT